MKLFALFAIFIVIFSLGEANFEDINRNKTWWRNTIIYQLFVRSFKDSNGDGIGDINGVIEKLDHFVDLKIETLWLTPFCESPMLDMGYDVSNFIAIDPSFGSMDDFRRLLKELKKRGMKLLMDLVINHSSNEHPWFVRSIRRIHPYSDYYVWRDAKGFDKNGDPIPPNNWRSLYEGKAWTWHPVRKQFYYHYFSKEQPDLNMRNPRVRQEILKIIDFWFQVGVDGYRLDAPVNFFEDPLMRDAELKDPSKISEENATFYDYVWANKTWYHPDTFAFLHYLLEFMDKKYNNNTDSGASDRIMTCETVEPPEIEIMFYGNDTYKFSHFPYLYDLEMSDQKAFLNATLLRDTIQWWLDHVPKGSPLNWATENHDRFRIADRLNKEYGDVILILTMLLPGTVTVYYGQEIGMSGINIRDDLKKDHFHNPVLPTRDAARLPMQWDDSPQAGFTSNHKPWLPVNPDYWAINVRAQRRQKHSRYHLFKDLATLRREYTMIYGDCKTFVLSNWVFAFERSLPGNDTYLVVMNIGAESETVVLGGGEIHNLPPYLSVNVTSLNSGYKHGAVLSRYEKVNMRPYSSIVFRNTTKPTLMISKVVALPLTSSGRINSGTFRPMELYIIVFSIINYLSKLC